jgi:hypothetical protein
MCGLSKNTQTGKRKTIMPNWCSNSLKLTATTDNNRKLLDELEKQFDSSDKAVIFDMIKPTPLDLLEGQGWYDWRIKNWGTKWDATLLRATRKKNSATLYFETAWAPPIEIYKVLEEEGFKVEATYVEQGVQYAGHYKNGNDFSESSPKFLQNLYDEETDTFNEETDGMEDYFLKAGFKHSPMTYGG